ncbi:S53 family peptidase [Nocardioides terrisoli]|uniref:S53 family peptidase n=1 Tax=Nocardioides terrisoli TaxID=3388267 RepID=UPI00287B6570|nr:S53 family peptidase [Nocardioides marmorisolisilvae]
MTRIAPSVAAIAAAAALAAATTGLLSPAQAASNGRSTLPGSTPAWAKAQHRVGSTPGSQPVDFRVYLDWRGGDAAQKLAESVSTPGSPDYGKFLTPAQFHQQFSPNTSTVNAVESWLKGQGFKVTSVPGNRKYVEATGTASQAASAFKTSFAEYKVQGQTVRSNTTALSIPSTLTHVEAVIGLDESQTLAIQHKAAPPPPVFVNAQPCSSYWGEKTVDNTPTPDGTVLPATPDYAFAPCGYAGKQLQGAYGMSGAISSGNDGSGVTIGVIDAYASPTIVSDVETYSAKHGLPSIKGHFSQIVPPGTYNRATNKQQDPGGWSGEETLDIEAAHTMAPGADIVYIGAPNNYRDLDAIMNKVVDNHLADIVTNSYGYGGEALPTGYIKPQLDTQAQAAAEGISLLFSSGDNGDETGGVDGATPTPDWPASSPLVTAVGGTALGVDQGDSRQFELGWETEKQTLNADGTWSTPFYLYGAGGGTSRLFAQPSYQAGVVPSSISQTYGGAPMRAVPDVSALADPTTGMLVGQTQSFPDGHAAYSEYRIGGTSLASPLYAGMLALAMQQAGHPFGLANPVLYNARSASYDITTADKATYPGAVRADYVNGVDGSAGYVYSVRGFGDDGDLTIHVRNGYDDVTGVGSPNGQAWLDAVAGQ